MPSSFIATVPKAELHLHLVGSASVDTVATLAARHPDAGVPADPAGLREFYSFRDFAHFIDVYQAVNLLIVGAEDVVELVVGAARDAARSAVRWAELTVTPDSHLLAGIGAAQLREALEEGRTRAAREHGVQIGWIVDIPGERGLAAAETTVRFLEEHAPDGTVAIGLAGLEDGVPRAQFAGHIRRARWLGLRAAIHAGESTGPETVWSAIRDLEADRIGHGISSLQDPSLLDHLYARQIPIEMCVTSNVRTGVVPDTAHHPVAEFLRRGLLVTLSTDDPGMFDTDLNREYEIVANLAGLDPTGIRSLARASVTASFAPDGLRRTLLAEIDATT